MPAMMRSLSSCFDATRMWRRTERANLEKNPSTRLSQEPCLGVKVNSKRPGTWAASQVRVSLEMCAGPPSSLVQLRIAVWTGDTRDTRPQLGHERGAFAAMHGPDLLYSHDPWVW